MEIILWLAFFFVILKLIQPSSVKTVIQCIMHKWEYKDVGDGNEYLVCTTCNKRPGESLDDGSEL